MCNSHQYRIGLKFARICKMHSKGKIFAVRRIYMNCIEKRPKKCWITKTRFWKIYQKMALVQFIYKKCENVVLKWWLLKFISIIDLNNYCCQGVNIDVRFIIKASCKKVIRMCRSLRTFVFYINFQEEFTVKFYIILHLCITISSTAMFIY